ncbi:MAG TPA: PTS sugar transporter subunit IIA, partial [Chitinispirillaceae bacterium]|nr:PTS sugar transporter subunit IIA [Chitinispirillaceae bacterium]
PGGEMHIVIGTLALNLQLINETVFVAIIISAIISTLTLGPALSFMIRRIVPQRTVQIPSQAAIEIPTRPKFEVLQFLSEHAAQLFGVNPDTVYDLAKNREDGMSTALENGIAIPHARIPDIQGYTVVFGRSQAGIDWNSPDGLPAKLIFLIVTPYDEMDSQLQIYRQLVRVLSKKDYRDAITNANTLESAVETLNDGLRLTAIAG